MQVTSHEYAPFASETLVVSTTVKTLTAGTYAPSDQRPAGYAEITVEEADLRYWKDGSTPSATAGHRRKVDTEILSLHGIHEISNFKAIREGGTDSKIRVTYFR